MAQPDDTRGKGKPDLNVQHRTMDQVMLDHMKLCHPDWLAELTESEELDDFIADHVERAGNQYGRSVEKGVQPLLARERAMRDHLLIDPLGDSQKYHFDPEQDSDTQIDEGEDENEVDNAVTSDAPKSSGKTNFPIAGFSIEWDGDGLRVRAIDYHATELLLGWDYLLSLAEAARDSNPGPPD